MSGIRWPGLWLMGALALGPAAACVARAQTEQPAQAATAHQLARAFLAKIDIDRVLDETINATRSTMIGKLKGFGKDDAEAADLIDRLMIPEFHARTPELRTRLEGILASDFTSDELQAVLNNENNAARQSAIAKVPQMHAAFTNAGRSWGAAVGRDTFVKNHVTFEKLGIDEKAIAQ